MSAGPRRAAPLLLCAAALVTATACGGGDRAGVQEEFCKVPVSTAALAPLVPQDGAVRQSYAGGTNPPHAGCYLTAGGKQVLAVNFYRRDEAPDPQEWKLQASSADGRPERPVTFLGHAAVGNHDAVVWADCVSPDAYMSFVISFAGDRVETTSTGYRKLLRFVDAFVPNVTKKFGCSLRGA